MPPGARVFCSLRAHFRARSIAKMPVYSTQGYIHTNARLGYGAMKNRGADAWQLNVAAR